MLIWYFFTYISPSQSYNSNMWKSFTDVKLLNNLKIELAVYKQQKI